MKALTLLGVTTSMMILFSQTDSMQGWSSLVGTVVNIGFAGVVGWYLLTQALPQIQDKAAQYAKEQKDSFLKEIAEKRTDFLTELRAMREQFRLEETARREEHRKALALVTEHCERESQRRDEMLRCELDALNSTLQGLSSAVEEMKEAIYHVRMNPNRSKRQIPPGPGGATT